MHYLDRRARGYVGTDEAAPQRAAFEVCETVVATCRGVGTAAAEPTPPDAEWNAARSGRRRNAREELRHSEDLGISIVPRWIASPTSISGKTGLAAKANG